MPKNVTYQSAVNGGSFNKITSFVKLIRTFEFVVAWFGVRHRFVSENKSGTDMVGGGGGGGVGTGIENCIENNVDFCRRAMMHNQRNSFNRKIRPT